MEYSDYFKMTNEGNIESPMKPLFSVCLSLLQSISSIFFLGCRIVFFFYIFHEFTLFYHLRNNRVYLLKIIYFCSYLGKKCSKTGNLVGFFSEIWHLIFLTAVWKENHCDVSLLIQNPISFKILVLELFHNMLLTYQIVGIQKL